MKKLTDLEFYVCIWDWNDKKYRPFNLFESSHVLRSVALYRTGQYEKFLEYERRREKETGWSVYKNELERWASWCFSDTRGRVQWEFGFGDPFLKSDGSWEGSKTDVYTIFILPNAKLLKQMVDEVSVASCKRYIREENKRLGRYARKVK